MYHDFFLSATNKVCTTPDYLIGTKKHAIFMGEADLQQELSVLMVGVPSGGYLAASCRIRGRSLLWQQRCHQTG